MDPTALVVGLAVVWFVCGCLGAWVARQKGRGGDEGFYLGFLFGPFGVLIEALLPNKAAGSEAVASGKRPGESIAQRRQREREERRRSVDDGGF
jgi:hypothetical protein